VTECGFIAIFSRHGQGRAIFSMNTSQEYEEQIKVLDNHVKRCADEIRKLIAAYAEIHAELKALKGGKNGR